MTAELQLRNIANSRNNINLVNKLLEKILRYFSGTKTH
jgi:hypothetical protein